MDGHVGFEIQTFNFLRCSLVADFKDDEASGSSCMTSDGAKVLTGNRYSHGVSS